MLRHMQPFGVQLECSLVPFSWPLAMAASDAAGDMPDELEQDCVIRDRVCDISNRHINVLNSPPHISYARRLVMLTLRKSMQWAPE